MRDSFLMNERLVLRAVEPEDLEILYTMENDSRTWDVSNFTVPYSRYLLKQYIEHSQCDMFADRQLRLMIMTRDEGRVVGTVDITDFSPMHWRGEVGIALLHECQGQGYAREALILLCEYAFDFLHMKQLVSHVLADNENSLKLFLSCGFAQCGLLKEWWRVGGKYKDALLLQKLRPENTSH
ncbi:MAG: GNAT family N-acetyltransferase [Bacteroides sp.]|nr:GNAT family N-acetyltransferase [Bacteroides sp.]